MSAANFERGTVINLDGDLLMKTKFGNWVTEGVFKLTDAQVDEDLPTHPWHVVFNPEDHEDYTDYRSGV